MSAAGKTQTARARFCQRWFSNPSQNQVNHVHIPDDVTILTRDPSPCFACGARDGCRHRPWERELTEQSA